MASNSLYHKLAIDYLAAIENNAYNVQYERPSLSALMPPLRNLSVLDLGCGRGFTAG